MSGGDVASMVFALVWVLGELLWPLRLRVRYPKRRASRVSGMPVRPYPQVSVAPFDRNGTRYRW